MVGKAKNYPSCLFHHHYNRAVQGTSIVFITHDIGLAYYLSDYVLIMHRGKIVESGSPGQVIIHPKHPYTRGLINDVPTLHKKWALKEG